MIEYFFILSGLLFFVSAFLAYMFQKEFLLGNPSREWIFLFTGLSITGLALFFRAADRLIDLESLIIGSRIGVFLGAVVVCLSCFIFWNRFRV